VLDYEDGGAAAAEEEVSSRARGGGGGAKRVKIVTKRPSQAKPQKKQQQQPQPQQKPLKSVSGAGAIDGFFEGDSQIMMTSNSWTFVGSLEVEFTLNGAQIPATDTNISSTINKKVTLCFSGYKAMLVTKDGGVVMSCDFTENNGPNWLKTLRRVCKSGSGFISGSLSFPSNPVSPTLLLLLLRLRVFVSGDFVLAPGADADSHHASAVGVSLVKLLHPEPELRPCPFELFALYKMVHSDNSLPLAQQPLGLFSELVRRFFLLLLFFFFLFSFFFKKKKFTFSFFSSFHRFHFRGGLCAGCSTVKA
jgi:hypothetical protein